MGLDELLSASDDGLPGDRAAARDRRRAVLLAGVAVAVATGLGVGVGLLAGALDGDGPRRLTAAPAASPSVVRPSAPAPLASTAPPTTAPTPTPSAPVPASGADVGYLVDARESPVEGEALSLRFDRVQFFTGEQARREAARRGDEADSDYYVVNDNALLRTLSVAPEASVIGDGSFNAWAGDGGRGPRPRTLHELARFVATDQGRETLFDLRYDAQGRVVAVAERYLP